MLNKVTSLPLGSSLSNALNKSSIKVEFPHPQMSTLCMPRIRLISGSPAVSSRCCRLEAMVDRGGFSHMYKQLGCFTMSMSYFIYSLRRDSRMLPRAHRWRLCTPEATCTVPCIGCYLMAQASLPPLADQRAPPACGNFHRWTLEGFQELRHDSSEHSW